jgi:uncharacterized circularly permuted ATP-grasp superfamily protein
MTSVSRAAQSPAPADDPEAAVPEENGPAAAPLFDNYLSPDRPNPGAYDEMFSSDGSIRGPYRALHEAIAPTAAADLKVRSEALDRAYVDQGITFSLSGKERPFPLDIVPRVISAAEWAKLQRGIVQRVQALEMFLADIYGDAEIVRDGVLPRGLITSCEHFHRTAAGLVPPNGVRIHVAGIDLVRDEQGVFRVLEDNLRNPSGVSYVMENRRTMARVFPDLFTRQRVRTVGDYGTHLLRALRSAAAPNEADPTVVVLTPGVFNSAYFEHSLLARQMGVELVEGRDLFCRDNLVYMRTTQGDQRVDVIYRRIDDEFLDPLQFNPASVLGVAGMINAARAGNVVIANALTRVALPEGSLVVNSSQGGGSKDTWVLAAGRAPEGERELGEKGLATVAPASSPAAEMGPELSTSQQQQQQQQ